jgi:glycerate kinase
MAQALGFRLLDEQGNDLACGGAALSGLSRIDATAVHPGLRGVRCIGATDVTNPLCGPQGASAVYGPQKGADAAAVRELDAALARFAEIVQRDLRASIVDRPGAGAAGGLGAGLLAFLGAELVSGAKVVAEAADLEGRVRGADLVITGEGRLDGQTAYGKAPRFVAQAAKRAKVPVVCLAGYLGEGYESSAALFSEIQAMSDGTGPLPSREEAERQIAAASEQAVLRLLGRGVLA